MKLTSPAFDHAGRIPARYTCDGDNVNPPLTIEDVPPAARSLVLILEDPDVPRTLREDGMWDHWLVYDIPPKVRNIDEHSEPPGVHGAGTAGNENYYGPCPPDREHRYFFKLFALDTKLDLAPKSSKKRVQQAMEGHILAEAVLMGRYERS
jgi:Raf kinase inhibitor-like YbhB/YbcL family protein